RHCGCEGEMDPKAQRRRAQTARHCPRADQTAGDILQNAHYSRAAGHVSGERREDVERSRSKAADEDCRNQSHVVASLPRPYHRRAGPISARRKRRAAPLTLRSARACLRAGSDKVAPFRPRGQRATLAGSPVLCIDEKRETGMAMVGGTKYDAEDIAALAQIL